MAVEALYQVAWDLSDCDTRKRETDGLLEAYACTGCDNLFIITSEEEEELTFAGRTIHVLPAWKWLLKK